MHVHGKISVRDDEKFVRAVVARLTRTHELRAGEEKPWKMADSEKAFIDQMIAAIVGIEVSISRIVGKWKVSQNKDERDRHSAADALEARGDALMAAAMRAAVQPKD